MWPNFAAVEGLKVVLPTVIADEQELVQLRAAVEFSRFTVCELTAPEEVLRERVTAREPNDYWKDLLRTFVDMYHRRSDLERIRDFQVSTDDRTVEDAAREVVDKAGWLLRPRRD